MRKYLSLISILSLLALAACDATSDNLYRPSEKVEDFEEHAQQAELQQINLGDAGQQQNSGGAGHWALLSGFGRLNYTFNALFKFSIQ